MLDTNGNVLRVENTTVEILEKPVKVYNFQVEDFHTYHVGDNGVLVHNANCKLIPNADGSFDAELSYKEDWTPEQRFEADQKVKALSDADTVKTTPDRKGTQRKQFEAKNGKGSVLSTQDIDHTIDLQLGGADNILNMNPLDKSVNRSLGSQINHLIKDLEPGTVLRNFSMK